jgi:hypothetical protein
MGNNIFIDLGSAEGRKTVRIVGYNGGDYNPPQKLGA